MRTRTQFAIIIFSFVVTIGLFMLFQYLGSYISKFGGIEPSVTILGAILVLIGLIYKPLYESLTDRKLELADYINGMLAIVLGISIILIVAALSFPSYDNVVKGILTLPFISVGLSLIGFFIIFIYMGLINYAKYRKETNSHRPSPRSNSGNRTNVSSSNHSDTKHNSFSNSGGASRNKRLSRRKTKRKRK